MPNRPTVVLSLDDFYSCQHNFPKLDRLDQHFDNFKVTMFAIPDCLPDDWVKMDVLTRPYLQMALHGAHHLFYECMNWDFVTAVTKITEAENEWTVKGFKAPFWIDSTGTLDACKKLGYWIALNSIHEPPYGEPPNGLKIYYHNGDISDIDYNYQGEYLKLHGHIQNVMGNGLSECLDNILKLPKDSKFIWIDDYVKKTGGDTLRWKFRDDIPYDCYSLAMHEFLGGNLTQSNVEELWDIAKAEGGPVLEIGGRASSMLFGVAVKDIVFSMEPKHPFNMQDYAQKHQARIMILGESKDPNVMNNVPKGFKAQILFVDKEKGFRIPSHVLSFVKDGGLIIRKDQNKLTLKRK